MKQAGPTRYPRLVPWFLVIFIGGALIGAVSMPVAEKLLPRSVKQFVTSIGKDESSTKVLNTNLYNLSLDVVDTPIPGRYGGIEPIGNDILAVDRYGKFWITKERGVFAELPLAVPANVSEFEASAAVDEQLRDIPGWADRTRRTFGVKHLLVEARQEGYRLYVSYQYWHADKGCLAIRVSYVDINEVAVSMTPVPPEQWTNAFESEPCLKLAENGGRIMAGEAGGRMVLLSDQELLLTIGDHGGLRPSGAEQLAQDDEVLYGKTVLINPATGESEIFTKGHRNPQGLTLAENGTIYSTEHGPNGGDELNVIVRGTNYGWPRVSFGRACKEFFGCEPDDFLHNLDIPIHQNLGSHEGYTRPVYSWVPSIGISNLIEVTGPQFELWKGDLLVTSLKQRTVYRVRLREERVMYVEPIAYVKRRIRDLIELKDGTIVLRLDNVGQLAYLTKNESRKEQLVAGCRACHSVTEGRSSGIGPNLWEVVDRPIAGAADFDYSDALKARNERWDKESLTAFLRDPASFAKGTTMPATNMSESEVGEIVDFLSSLK